VANIRHFGGNESLRNICNSIPWRRAPEDLNLHHRTLLHPSWCVQEKNTYYLYGN